MAFANIVCCQRRFSFITSHRYHKIPKYSIKLLATLEITKMIVDKINTTNYISDNIMSCATYVDMQHK